MLSTILLGAAVHGAEPSQLKFKFQAYDKDPKRPYPENMTFQINHAGTGAPTEFLKLGETVRGTNFKLLKFEYKTRTHPKYGEEDTSELTLLNTSTKETVVLVVPQIIHGVPRR